MLVVIVALSILSLGLVSYIADKTSPEKPARPTEIISMLIDEADPSKRLELVNAISVNQKKFPLQVYIVDQKNKIRSPYKEQGKTIKFEASVRNAEDGPESFRRRRRPLFPIRLWGRPPHPPPHHLENSRRKLKGTDDQYLVFKPKLRKKAQNKSFFLSLSALLGSLFLGIVCTIAFMVLIFRRQNRSMDEVIEKMKKGDLKARVHLGRFDEFAQSKIKFNEMAEEIEVLVNSLRRAESSRKHLMSELAHDLRTPIASLKSLLELILNRKNVLGEEKIQSLLKTSVKEVDYFSLLVDDLLFLGQVNLPQYRKKDSKINISKLINLEVSDLASRYEHLELKLSFKDDLYLNFDKKLMTRLMRNVLENSFSFARSEVSILIEKTQTGFMCFTFKDDGPGFSEQNLISFGKKKFSRQMNLNSGERISIGLGSVIMQSIVDSYGGWIEVSNNTEKNRIQGAVVKIFLSQN